MTNELEYDNNYDDEQRLNPELDGLAKVMPLYDEIDLGLTKCRLATALSFYSIESWED